MQVGLDLDGEAGDDSFGETVSLSGDGSVVAISAPQKDDNGSGSGGSGGGSTEVTEDFKVASTGVSTSRPSNGDAVEVDMSSITQSGSVTVTQ